MTVSTEFPLMPPRSTESRLARFTFFGGTTHVRFGVCRLCSGELDHRFSLLPIECSLRCIRGLEGNESSVCCGDYRCVPYRADCHASSPSTGWARCCSQGHRLDVDRTGWVGVALRTLRGRGGGSGLGGSYPCEIRSRQDVLGRSISLVKGTDFDIFSRKSSRHARQRQFSQQIGSDPSR